MQKAPPFAKRRQVSKKQHCSEKEKGRNNQPVPNGLRLS
jgi:hypothetical protein